MNTCLLYMDRRRKYSMKKIIALLLAAVMVMCLFAGCASSGGSKVIKIGVFEPQSGDNGASDGKTPGGHCP